MEPKVRFVSSSPIKLPRAISQRSRERAKSSNSSCFFLAGLRGRWKLYFFQWLRAVVKSFSLTTQSGPGRRVGNNFNHILHAALAARSFTIEVLRRDSFCFMVNESHCHFSAAVSGGLSEKRGWWSNYRELCVCLHDGACHKLQWFVKMGPVTKSSGSALPKKSCRLIL